MSSDGPSEGADSGRNTFTASISSVTDHADITAVTTDNWCFRDRTSW